MIECPWCSNEVVLEQQVCPVCQHEVLTEHLNPPFEGDESLSVETAFEKDVLDLETKLMNEFQCSKCGHEECEINEVAMTGAGLSKVLNLQYHHYLFRSCMYCGAVDIYDPSVLRRK
ncbi:zinc ribbon domain-containing protein [Paenibacillus paridis]|uniref:zinc ribbon domain-containing protein n=1 Tax=Paenibacillus paridis TaxID=2583376 RepID=UPI00111DBC81|nr:zinc ribbon domain-containing protein [Paenibacillus paridis]